MALLKKIYQNKKYLTLLNLTGFLIVEIILIWFFKVHAYVDSYMCIAFIGLTLTL